MNHPYEERYQAEPFIGAAASGGFTAEEIKGTGQNYLYHSIHIIDEGANKGKCRLAGDGDRVDGSFVSFDGGLSGSPLIIYSFRQKGMRFRNGTGNIFGLGQKILGATRTGATPLLGYVRPFGDDDIAISFTTLTTAVANTLDGTVSDTQLNAFKATIQDPINALLLDLYRARGIVRGPEGARHQTLATRPEADVIVEFGFE